MAEQTKLSPTQPRPKGSRTVKAAEFEEPDTNAKDEVQSPVVEETVEELVAAPAVELVTEPVAEVAPEQEAEDSDVEAMSKRGRKSKNDPEVIKRRTREDIESNYANLIAHEPAKADLFREELRLELKERNLL
jgi:hypothetical protein